MSLHSFLIAYLLVIANLIRQAFCQGQIMAWDLSVDFLNVNYAREFSIGFSLESGLSNSDYLKVYFPFSLHASKTGDVPNGLKAELSFVGSSGCTPITALAANIFHKVDNTYYIQFLNEKGLPNRPLEKNTWYLLKLIITAALVPSQTMSIKLPLAIKSVSAIDEAAHVYDVNNVFGVLELLTTPNSNLKGVATISGDNKNLLDAIYTVFLDITPQTEVKNYGRFMISMVDDSFKFNGATCSSILKNITRYFPNGTLENYTVIPALESFEYSCSIDATKNRVWIYINGTIVPDKLYRFKLSIRNPKNVVAQGGLKIYSMDKFANRIVEITTIGTLFSTTGLSWGTSNQNLKIFLGWGVDMSQANLPDAFKFVRGTLSGTAPFYNGIKFIFKPSFETPSGLELKLEIMVPESTAGFAVLDGSISDNLPRFISSYGSKPVVCSVDRTTLTSQKVICKGIGTLSNLSEYFVGIKAFIPYAAAAPDLQSDFGKLTLYSFNTLTNSYDVTPIIATGRNEAVQYKTVNNLDWIPQFASNGWTAVHSQAQTVSGLTAITSTTYGIKTSSSKQNLVFTMLSKTDDIKGTGAQLNYAGLHIFTTKSITETSVYNPADPDLDGNLASIQVVTPVNYPGGRIGHDYSTGKDWTWVKIFDSNVNIFASSGGTTTFTIGVQDIMIELMSGHYPDQVCFDFYAATYNNIKATLPQTPVLTKNFAFNSYAFSGTNIGSGANDGNIKVSLVNYWTGDLTHGNLVGDKFPAFIRIFGYLDPQLLVSVTKIGVFFDYLTYFSTQVENGQTKIGCGTTFNLLGTSCYGYTGIQNGLDSFHKLSRVEVDVSFDIQGTGQASPFQIIIPMASVNAKGTVNILVTTMCSNIFYGSSKPYSSVLNSFSTFYTFTFTPSTSNLANAAGLSSIDYKLDFTISPQPIVGQTASIVNAKIKNAHNDASSVVNANANPNYGAGFTYQGDWNMLRDSPKFFSSWISSSMNSVYCVCYSYVYLTTTKYGFFCPLSSGTVATTTFMTVKNFVYPNANGVRVPANTVGVWSDKSGYFKSSDEQISTTSYMTNGLMILIDYIMRPILLKGSKQNRLKWSFTTVNEFPLSGKIKITIPTGWTFTPDGTAPCVLKAEIQANDRSHTCVLTFVLDSYLLFTFSSSDTSPFPRGNYNLYLYGVDVLNANNFDNSYTIETQTSGGITIDKSLTSGGQIKHDNTGTLPFVSLTSIELGSVSKNVMSTVTIEFSANREIFKIETIRVNFGSLATATLSTGNVFCNIYEKATGEISTLFKSIAISSLTNIILTPKDDILTLNMIFRLKCHNVIMPNTALSNQITIEIKRDANLICTSQTSSSLQTLKDTTDIGASKIILIKYYNQPGMTSEVEFNITLDDTNQITVNPLSSLTVVLPSYYNPYGYVSCSVNTLDTYCFFKDKYQLQISSFPETKFNETITIKIYGINLPVVSTTSKLKFYLSIDNDSGNPEISNYFGTVLDQETFDDIMFPINIYFSEISSLYIRETSSLSFYFLFSGADVPSGYYVSIDFLQTDEYLDLLKMKPFSSCNLISIASDGALGSNLLSTCELLGLRVTGLLAGDGLIRNTKYVFTLDGIENPENEVCNMKKWLISIVTNTKKKILLRSTATSSNIQPINFIENPLKSYIGFKDNLGNVIKVTENLVNMVVGVFGSPLRIYNNRGNFKKPIAYSLNSFINLFSIEADFGVEIGDEYEEVLIGTSHVTPPTLYNINFKKLETEPYIFSNFELLRVEAKVAKLIFQPNYLVYKVCPLGLTNPIIFDLSDKRPFHEFTVTANVFTSGVDLGLIFEDTGTNTTQLTFTRSNYVQMIRVVSSVNKSTISSIDRGSVSFIISGVSSPSYYAPERVTVKLDAFPPLLPIINVVFDTRSQYIQKEALRLTPNCPMVVYYVVSLGYAMNRNFSYVLGKVKGNYKFSYADFYQEQFGFFNLENLEETIFYFTKLRSNIDYKFTLFPMNQYGVLGEAVKGNFKTRDNSGKVMRLGIIFAGSPTKSDIEVVGCWLCSYFAIPCPRVLTYDGIHCQNYSYPLPQQRRRILEDQSRLLQVMAPSNSSSNSTTSNTNSTPSTNGTTSNSTTSKNGSNSSNSSNASNISVHTEVFYYFTPNVDSESDLSFSTISTETQKSYFISALTGNFTSNPNVSELSTIAEVSQIEPELDSVENVSAVGQTWIFISGMRLKSRGFILFIIDPVSNYNKSQPNSGQTNSSNNSNSSNSTSNTSANASSTPGAPTINNTNTSVNTSTSNSASGSGTSRLLAGKNMRFLQTDTTNFTITNKLNDTFWKPFFPYPIQIKAGRNSFNEFANKTQTLFYNYTNLNINITGLQNSTEYVIFFTSSSENPSMWALLGSEVKYVVAKTLDPPKLSVEIICSSVILLLCIFISITLLF